MDAPLHPTYFTGSGEYALAQAFLSLVPEHTLRQPTTYYRHRTGSGVALTLLCVVPLPHRESNSLPTGNTVRTIQNHPILQAQKPDIS